MKINNSWFTLIEFLIAITIFMILVMMSFAPYQYYSNVTKVKLASKEISQAIAETKNLAINWFDKSWVNQSTALYIDKKNEWTLKIYSYNYSSGFTNIPLNDKNLLKEEKLPDWVFVKDISWKDSVILYFSSIYWVPTILNGSWNVINDDSIFINVSFKNSLDPKLNKKITFYRSTSLTDY